MRAKRGFTLIEILVVLLIIGISSSIAFIAFGDFGAGRKIVVAGEQFSSYMQFLQQRAILESNTFGVKLDKDSYETLSLKDGVSWQSMPKTSHFHRQYFPKKSVVVFKRKFSNAKGEPDIIVYPSGEMSEFELMFGSATEPDLITLIGKRNGELVLTHEHDHDQKK